MQNICILLQTTDGHSSRVVHGETGLRNDGRALGQDEFVIPHAVNTYKMQRLWRHRSGKGSFEGQREEGGGSQTLKIIIMLIIIIMKYLLSANLWYIYTRARRALKKKKKKPKKKV